MRSIWPVLIVVFVTTSISLGGTVTFETLGDTHVLPGETVAFEVSITPSESLGSFDSVALVFGSNELELVSFHYDDFWLSDPFPHPLPISTGIYPSDFFVGGFFSTPSRFEVIGILTVVVPGELATGNYSVLVDSNIDEGLSAMGLGSTQEPLFGSANVTVIPEPATLVLLGVGGSAVIRRKYGYS